MTHREQAIAVFEAEAAAIQGLAARLDNHFDEAIARILASTGRAVVCGMGKSGLIGKKIVATLASTGTPSFFLHPAEAFHGDLGMLRPEDILISISNSGETDEILRLLPSLERIGVEHIAITGNRNSTLARHAQVVLDISIPREACPLQLAPMASTTATLAMGDAIAAALMTARGFREEDFALFHPGGSLGRKLLTRVGDEMKRQPLPVCPPEMRVTALISRMSEGRLGLVVVTDADNRVLGLITDGDLRRALAANETAFFSLTAANIMTANPRTIGPDEKVAIADDLMQQVRITALIVADETGHLLGVYHRIA